MGRSLNIPLGAYDSALAQIRRLVGPAHANLQGLAL